MHINTKVKECKLFVSSVGDTTIIMLCFCTIAVCVWVQVPILQTQPTINSLYHSTWQSEVHVRHVDKYINNA